jgi:hypothetical protein
MAIVSIRDGKYVDRWEIKPIDITHFSMRMAGSDSMCLSFHVGEFAHVKSFYEALNQWLRGQQDINGMEFVREECA